MTSNTMDYRFVHPSRRGLIQPPPPPVTPPSPPSYRPLSPPPYWRFHHQSGRRSKDTPYAKPGGNKALSSRISGLNASPSSSKKKTRNGDPRRAPAGTPDILRNDDRKGAQARQQRQHSNLNAILKGDEIKGWLRSRIIAPGVLNFSVCPQHMQLADSVRTSMTTHGSRVKASSPQGIAKRRPTPDQSSGALPNHWRL